MEERGCIKVGKTRMIVSNVLNMELMANSGTE